jgi:hypothetical protein
MPYKFDRDELLKLLMRAYEEGNCGYLDLSESVAEKLIEENEDKYSEIRKHQYPNVFCSDPELTENSLPADRIGDMSLTISSASPSQPHNFDNLVISNSNQGGYHPDDEPYQSC